MQGDVASTEQIFSAQRRAMVDGQIRTFDVTDARVVRAFDLTRRELFLPDALRAFAYSDAPLTLRAPDGRPLRTLMQPMHLARLLQGVDPAPDAHVLVVAGGAGYAAAILLELVASVVTLEADPSLTADAAANCSAAGGRVTAVTGPLAEGHAPASPYDAILVLGGVETNLAGLFRQLKPQGVLAAVSAVALENGRRSGRAVLYRPTGGDVSGRAIFDVSAPILPEFREPTAFVF